MLSATAADSRSLRISYQVITAPMPGQPLTFGVYRSSDPVFDPGDSPAATWTSAGSGQTLDANGQPVDALGTHTLTIPLPNGLPIDPAQPYVLIVADPALPSALADPSQTASIRTHVIGIVTHGGLQNPHWKYGPAWQAKTAAILRQQGYDDVIAYNWVSASNHPGEAARQGPRLANEILAAASQFPAMDPVDLHFIGHSEGAVVNTQAIVALEAQMTPQLKAGYIKDTLLDPHAANNAIKEQYSTTSGMLGWLAQTEITNFQAKAKDPPVFVPSIVNDAEVFYQHTSADRSHGVNNDIYNLWGQVPVKGPANYYNLTASRVTHAGETGVSNWYANFVAPTLADGAPQIAALRLDGHLDQSGTAGSISVATSPLGANPVVLGHRAQFSGTAEAGSVVRLFVGPAGDPGRISQAGITRANANGGWSISTPILTTGRYRALAMAFSRASRTRPGMTVVPMVPLGAFNVVKPGQS
jgi:hypothetical protein